MFKYSNNYGMQCIVASCARDKQCGPAHSHKVCGEGETCTASGQCRDSGVAAALGMGDDSDALLAAYSNNHLGACAENACAMDHMCGVDNGFQVCMAGQTCVSGRCMMNYVFESKKFSPDVVELDYSNNARGVCHQCAAGHLQLCGGDQNLVCPGDLVCAKRPPPVKEDNADDADSDADADGATAPGGVTAPSPPPEAPSDPTFDDLKKGFGEKTGGTYGKPQCFTPDEIRIFNITDDDIVDVPHATESHPCDRPDLISLPRRRRTRSVRGDVSGCPRARVR